MAFYTGTRYGSEKYAAMVDLLKEIAAKWNSFVNDLCDEPYFNAVSPEDYSRYMADPIHPTLEGYKEWWAPYIEKKMIEIMGTPLNEMSGT